MSADSMQPYVTLKQLAQQMSMDRSNARKYILRQGIRPVKRRAADSGNQLALTVTEEEAENILMNRKKEGFSEPDEPVSSDFGCFYVVLIVPEFSARRIKLGFTTNISERLSQYRTVAPTAVVIKTWPCKRTWEEAVIDCLTSQKCKLVKNEVFECDDIDQMLQTGRRLFDILPDLSDKI